MITEIKLNTYYKLLDRRKFLISEFDNDEETTLNVYKYCDYFNKHDVVFIEDYYVDYDSTAKKDVLETRYGCTDENIIIDLDYDADIFEEVADEFGTPL